jgi:hypothetical protein
MNMPQRRGDAMVDAPDPRLGTLVTHADTETGA